MFSQTDWPIWGLCVSESPGPIWPPFILIFKVQFMSDYKKIWQSWWEYRWLCLLRSMWADQPEEAGLSDRRALKRQELVFQLKEVLQKCIVKIWKLLYHVLCNLKNEYVWSLCCCQTNVSFGFKQTGVRQVKYDTLSLCLDSEFYFENGAEKELWAAELIYFGSEWPRCTACIECHLDSDSAVDPPAVEGRWVTLLRHVSVNQVEDSDAPASISTRISFSIPRIESANLGMVGRGGEMGGISMYKKKRKKQRQYII